MDKLVINTRDKLTFEIPIRDFDNMEDFYLKNMLDDTNDDDPIIINEDLNIIKNVIDSMRYRKLIFDKETNLRLMYMLSDKWCCPDWLLNSIEEELYMSPKLRQINNFIEKLTNNIYRCKNCGMGFNKYNNKPNSCKIHDSNRTIAGTNLYSCCNKEEPCKVGYHVLDCTEINIHIIKPILEKGFE